MCVHPTKTGDQCKREPNKTLCSTHLINISLVPSDKFPGIMYAPKIDKLFIMHGDDVFAEFIPHPTPEDEAEYQRQHADRKPAGYIRCGACHQLHPNKNLVKICYANKRRTTEKMG